MSIPPQQIQPPPIEPLVLIVEDDEMTREILTKMVRDIPYQVLTANGGREALEIYQRQKPDLLLLDLVMPEMDGFAVGARLRELDGDDVPPILVVTSVEDQDTIRRAL